MEPSYPPGPARAAAAPAAAGWIEHPGGMVEIGHDGDRFAFDNERPRHRAFLEPFALARLPVTCGEYQAFIDDGGYRRPELWLSDGWDLVEREGWQAPLYWQPIDGGHRLYTLRGWRPVDPAEAVCHVSLYEADAYARWAGARLPGEEEWEAIAAAHPVTGNFLDSGLYHPAPPAGDLHGDVWQWTASSYAPYRGFRAFAGAFGEYNGKFMSSRMVLRGGSCATPADHVRPTYRNFFTPDARWQFSGIRLARS